MRLNKDTHLIIKIWEDYQIYTSQGKWDEAASLLALIQNLIGNEFGKLVERHFPSVSSAFPAIHKLPSSLDIYQRTLTHLREFIEQNLNLATPRGLLAYSTLQFKLLFKQIWNTVVEHYKLAELPPHAVLFLGSLAREEATPRSDIEYIILIKENNEFVKQAHRKHFQLVSELIQLTIIQMGETFNPVLEKFNVIIPKGFSLDKTKVPNSKQFKNGLVVTPSELANFHLLDDEHFVHQSGCHLSAALLVSDYLPQDGEADNSAGLELWYLYQKQVAAIHQIPNHSFSFARKIFNLENKNFQIFLKAKNDLSSYFIKQLYRIFHVLMDIVLLCHRRPIANIWDMVENFSNYPKGLYETLFNTANAIAKLRLNSDIINLEEVESIRSVLYLMCEAGDSFFNHIPHSQEGEKFYLLFHDLFLNNSKAISFNNNQLIEKNKDTLFILNRYIEEDVVIEFDFHKKSTLLPHLKAAIDTFSYQSDYATLVKSWMNVARLYKANGYPLAAVNFYHKSLFLLQQSGYVDNKFKMILYNEMGRAYQALAMFKISERYYRQAEFLYQSGLVPQLNSQAVFIYNNLGMICLDIAKNIPEPSNKKYSSLAIDYLTQAMDLSKKTNGETHVMTIRCLNNLGEAYRQVKNFSQAHYYVTQALLMGKQSYPNISNRILSATYFNMGKIWLKLNNDFLALECFIQAADFSKKACGENHPLYARHLMGVAKANIELKEYKQAQENLSIALVVLQRTRDSKHPLWISIEKNNNKILNSSEAKENINLNL